MKDSQDFGKVQTYEELRMLRELELHYKKHQLKSRRKYSRQVVLGGREMKDTVVISLDGSRGVVNARKGMSHRKIIELLGEGLITVVNSSEMNPEAVLDWLKGHFTIKEVKSDEKER